MFWAAIALKSSMEEEEGFCMAFGRLEPDFLQLLISGLYEPGLDTVSYRFVFALTILLFVFLIFLRIFSILLSQMFSNSFQPRDVCD